jgi:hypothetical protein
LELFSFGITLYEIINKKGYLIYAKILSKAYAGVVLASVLSKRYVLWKGTENKAGIDAH